MKNFWFNFIISAGKRKVFATIVGLVALSLIGKPAQGAVGCSLNDPDRDIKRLFPESTGYKSDFLSIKDNGGPALYTAFEKELGDTLDPIFEAIDVPYAFYTVLKGKTVIGYVHGVNQKGTYGVMQIILATDLEGRILGFYFQKLSSPEASKLRDRNFTRQFVGLTLDDIKKGNLSIKDPTRSNALDFKATLRGVKKNLLLLKDLKFSGGTKK